MAALIVRNAESVFEVKLLVVARVEHVMRSWRFFAKTVLRLTDDDRARFVAQVPQSKYSRIVMTRRVNFHHGDGARGGFHCRQDDRPDRCAHDIQVQRERRVLQFGHDIRYRADCGSGHYIAINGSVFSAARAVKNFEKNCFVRSPTAARRYLATRTGEPHQYWAVSLCRRLATCTSSNSGDVMKPQMQREYRLLKLTLAAFRGILSAVVLISASTGVLGQAPDPGRYSSEQNEIHWSLGNRVVMRDGVRLSVDIYQPKGSGRYPALLTITPYNNNGGWQERAKWFARRGYVVAIADTRGRYDSEGAWDPFDRRHKTDGYDLVEWIANQPWCNARVGMYGPSYMGWETWWTATQAPPSLKAIVPEVAPPDPLRNTPYQDGVLVGWMFNWEAGMAGRTNQDFGLGSYSELPVQTPYIELDRLRGVMDAPWFETWMRDNLSTSEYWKAISYQSPESYSKVTVPSLAVSGWFDCDHPGTPMNYLGMRQYGATPEARRPRMVIGPWPHGPIIKRVAAGIDYGPDAEIDWDGYVTRWFDHFLKGIDNGVENDPAVHVFVMGANRWRAESDWPLPQTRWTKYYFNSEGNANSLNGDGLLSPTLTARNMFDKYVYDPARPTQSASADGQIAGAMDTTLSATGRDVLVYQTPPLRSAIEVIGPIEATLYAATSARDTNWFVRLVDVQPDGRSLLLAEGAMRARSRDPQNAGRFNSARFSTIEPGKVYQYTIQFWRGTANLFQKGHRIRVEISSSWFPYFAANMNTGADNLAMVSMREAVVATQSVFHGSRYPSHILLPVIPTQIIGSSTSTTQRR